MAIRASSVRETAISWLDDGRIARGKLTALSGDPGLGKSKLVAEWVARASRGEALTPSGRESPPINTLMLGEDDISDTTCPRLTAAGADLDRVYFSDSLEEVAGDVKTLQIGLVIIDPIAKFLGALNSADAVRQRIYPLVETAKQTQAAIVLLRHLVKSGRRSALHAGAGSVGITGAARIELLFGVDPSLPLDELARVLTVTKCNLAARAPSLGLSIGAGVAWRGVSASTADDVVTAGRRDSALVEAMAYLGDELAEGPCRSTHLFHGTRDNGISRATLRRAKDRLGVLVGKIGPAWWWALPEHDQALAELRRAHLEQVEHLEEIQDVGAQGDQDDQRVQEAPPEPEQPERPPEPAQPEPPPEPAQPEPPPEPEQEESAPVSAYDISMAHRPLELD